MAMWCLVASTLLRTALLSFLPALVLALEAERFIKEIFDFGYSGHTSMTGLVLSFCQLAGTLELHAARRVRSSFSPILIKSIDISMLSRLSIRVLMRRFAQVPAIGPPVLPETAQQPARQPPRQPPRPPPITKSNQLLGMPTEILQLIARFLPAPSEAALTLTCRTSLLKLGNRSWYEINTPSFPHAVHHKRYCCTPERETLIQLLDRDLKDLIYCYFCNILHSPSDLRNPVSQQRECAKVEQMRRKDCKERYLRMHDDLPFSEIQAFMKRHLRFGIDCSSQLQHMSKTSTVRAKTSTYQITTLARIISGHLVIRSEYWITVPWSKAKSALGAAETSNLKICPHSVPSSLHNYWLRHCAELTEKHNNGSIPCSECNSLQQCMYCATEFQMETAKIGKKGIAIAITVWQDLGDGSSPYNTKWEESRFVTYRKQNFIPGNIKAGFEDFSLELEKPVPLKALPKLYGSKFQRLKSRLQI